MVSKVCSDDFSQFMSVLCCIVLGVDCYFWTECYALSLSMLQWCVHGQHLIMVYLWRRRCLMWELHGFLFAFCKWIGLHTIFKPQHTLFKLFLRNSNASMRHPGSESTPPNIRCRWYKSLIRVLLLFVMEEKELSWKVKLLIYWFVSLNHDQKNEFPDETGSQAFLPLGGWI